MQVAIEQNPKHLDGVWTEYEGAKFKIARAGNPSYLKAIDKAEAPYRKQISRGKLSTEKMLDVQCQSMAEGILKGWKDISGPDGKDIDFTAEAAFNVLKFNPDVREFILDFATEQDNYRTEAIKATAKK